MKELSQWVQDIVFYMIFVTMIMNLLPDPKYEKYLRLFAGAALILIAVGPFTRPSGLETAFAGTFGKLTFDEEVRTLKEEIGDADGKRLQAFYEKYRETLESDMNRFAGEAGLEVISTKVQVSESGDDAGAIRHVKLVIRGDRRTVGNSVLELRRKIGAYYGVEEREIEVSVQGK